MCIDLIKFIKAEKSIGVMTQMTGISYTHTHTHTQHTHTLKDRERERERDRERERKRVGKREVRPDRLREGRRER